MSEVNDSSERVKEMKKFVRYADGARMSIIRMMEWKIITTVCLWKQI
ncbi:MAG: hypothetical protein K2M82_07755 [Lachnospiraceae bacterium]|nr:hypothetical protein [Lachnospiraceae bacterium]